LRNKEELDIFRQKKVLDIFVNILNMPNDLKVKKKGQN
jgi:hypothetical protein